MLENNRIEKKSKRILENRDGWKKIYKEVVAFANKTGGTIYIGIEDGNNIPPSDQNIDSKHKNEIKSKIEQNTLNAGVEVFEKIAENNGEYLEIKVFPSRSSIASTSDGKYYIRSGDETRSLLPDDLTRLMEDKASFVWELKNYLNISRRDFDEKKSQDLVKDIEQSDRVSPFIKEKTLDELLDHFFLAEGNYLTNLGVLWIGKRNHRAKLLYSPSIQVIKYDEHENKISKRTFDDFSLNPKELIHEIVTRTQDFKEYLEYPDGIFRKNIYFYDEVIIRELLANAIVHKPYTARGDIFINIFSDRIEFKNPGLLPLPVTPKNILHETRSRNPHLMSLSYHLKLVEKEGSGYDNIYEKLLFNGKRLPVIEEGSDFVSVTIFKSVIDRDVINLLDSITNEYQLRQKEKIALSLIAQHESLTLRELSRIIGVDEFKIDRNWLTTLIKEEIIKSKGKTSNTKYFINPTITSDYTKLSKTSLKTIEPHRLKALILEDIQKYPLSSRQDIHKRIGLEIKERSVRTYLGQLVEEGKILKEGDKKGTKYYIS